MNENRGTAIRRAHALVDMARLESDDTRGRTANPPGSALEVQTTAAVGSKPTPTTRTCSTHQTKPSASGRRPRRGANRRSRGIKANNNRPTHSTHQTKPSVSEHRPRRGANHRCRGIKANNHHQPGSTPPSKRSHQPPNTVRGKGQTIAAAGSKPTTTISQNPLRTANEAISLRPPSEAKGKPSLPRDQSQQPPSARIHSAQQTKPSASARRPRQRAIHRSRGIKANNHHQPESTPPNKRSHQPPPTVRGKGQSTAPAGSKPTTIISQNPLHTASEATSIRAPTEARRNPLLQRDQSQHRLSRFTLGAKRSHLTPNADSGRSASAT